MKAKAFLSRVGTEYRKVRKIREEMRTAGEGQRQEELRRRLKSAAGQYAGILKEVWDLIDEVEPGTEREMLVRKYIYLEPMEQICAESECTQRTGYTRHAKAVRAVQRLLDNRSVSAA